MKKQKQKQKKKFGIFGKRAPRLGSVEKGVKIDLEDELEDACWVYSGFPKDAIGMLCTRRISEIN